VKAIKTLLVILVTLIVYCIITPYIITFDKSNDVEDIIVIEKYYYYILVDDDLTVVSFNSFGDSATFLYQDGTNPIIIKTIMVVKDE
jgi:hypothetical protein